MNRCARQRPFAGFALVAALLLALMPSLSRLVETARLANDVAVLCSHDGLRYIGGHAQHDDAAHAHDEGDCAYCPLLAHGALPSMPVAFLAPPGLPTQRPDARSAVSAHTTVILAAQPRGPPHSFAA